MNEWVSGKSVLLSLGASSFLQMELKWFGPIVFFFFFFSFLFFCIALQRPLLPCHWIITTQQPENGNGVFFKGVMLCNYTKWWNGQSCKLTILCSLTSPLASGWKPDRKWHLKFSESLFKGSIFPVISTLEDVVHLPKWNVSSDWTYTHRITKIVPDHLPDNDTQSLPVFVRQL